MAATARKVSHHLHHDAAGIVREVEHVCTSRGLRLTPLRREVLELVAKARKPVKAYDLLESLRDNHRAAYDREQLLAEQRLLDEVAVGAFARRERI